MLDSTNSNPNFTNTVITGDESWIYGYDPEPVIFLTMKIRRQNQTLPHSNAASHQMMLITRMKVQGRFIEIHQVSAKKVQ